MLYRAAMDIKEDKKGSCASHEKLISLTQTKFFASYVSFVYVSND